MPFTVDAVPHLPADFGDTFTSRTAEVDGVALHAVVGGTGPALLLLPAWPQFWYGWRLVMPALAEHFTVVAADLRGMGASDKPATGYDAVTLADDMAGLMDASRRSIVRHVTAMLGFKDRGAVVFDNGNLIRTHAKQGGVERAGDDLLRAAVAAHGVHGASDDVTRRHCRTVLCDEGVR